MAKHQRDKGGGTAGFSQGRLTPAEQLGSYTNTKATEITKCVSPL